MIERPRAIVQHPVVRALWYAALGLLLVELWDTPGPDFRYFGL